MSGGAVEKIAADDGQKLALRRLGSGAPPLVAPAMSWMADDLERLAQSALLACYDVRGQGRSDPAPDAKIGFARDIADLECVRLALGAERVRLLGWSYHGAVTARYAWSYPGRVERMVLVAPVGPRAAPHWRGYLESFGRRLDQARLRALEQQRRAGLKERDPTAWCRAYTELILRVYAADPACLAGMRSTPCVQPNLDPELINRQMLKIIDGMGDYDWRREMAGLDVPTLILHGDRDPVPLQGSREWAEVLTDARLIVLEGCGHLPWLEQPQRFFEAVEAFLA